MVVTRLPTVRSTLATLVAAVTPSEDPGRPFFAWAPRLGLPEGASGHHGFVTEFLATREVVAHGDALSLKSSLLRLRVTYVLAGLRDADTIFDAITSDASAIALAIDRSTGWGAGVDAVETGDVTIEQRESGETDLLIELRVDAEET